MSGRLCTLLSKDFLKLVGIAAVIAFPGGMVCHEQLVAGFCLPHQYSVVGIYFRGNAAWLMALVTVSFQAIKAAIANPVKSLRTE